MGTWEFDPVADIVVTDPNLARMFGVHTKDASGGPIGVHLRDSHPDDRQGVVKSIGRGDEGGRGL